MALDPLASPPDLAARNITVPAGFNALEVLASATDAVRDAAGCPISVTTSTVELVIDDREEIDLPGGPVSAVASLSIDGNPIAASTLVGGLWSAGWRKVGDTLILTGVSAALPAVATVIFTHGYAVVPKDIVDLTCGLAAMAFRQDGDYGAAGLETSVRLGDYSESEKQPSGGSASPSPVAIPDAVRMRLRNRFGTTASVIGIRR